MTRLTGRGTDHQKQNTTRFSRVIHVLTVMRTEKHSHLSCCSWLSLSSKNDVFTERFVLRTRASPSCATECVKKKNMRHQECVRRHRSWMTTKNNKPSVSVFLSSSVRAEKARVNQVTLCFWCVVPLRTHPHTYHLRSAPSCMHGLFSVLVLKMSCSATTAALKSWSS